MSKPSLSLDRTMGMLMGVMLGDSLGAPHESKINAKLKYTGKLEYEWKGGGRFYPKLFGIGEFTDDSEQMITLARSLIRNGKYNRDDVILSYMKWAGTCSMLGKNTARLFGGKITTIKGYQNRFDRFFTDSISRESQQSNGALMRCAPLACLWNNNDVMTDVNLSNPSQVCRDAEQVYLAILRLGLIGALSSGAQRTGDQRSGALGSGDLAECWNYIKKIAETKEVKNCIQMVEDGKDYDLGARGKTKGWVIHGLYTALFCFYHLLPAGKSFSECMSWVIGGHPGADTDTIGAISGAVCGAYIGFNQFDSITKQNIPHVYTWEISSPQTDPKRIPSLDRPKEYRIASTEELENLATQLIKL